MANLQYIATVPSTNNNPMLDQPNMLINTQSIQSIIEVDHVGFNDPGNSSGQHTSIEFNQNESYVPGSFPISPPELFTTFGTSPPNLRYYSGTQAQSANQYVIAAQGSTMLLGGIIIKWGTLSYVQGTASFVVTFASPFPNACFNVQLTSNNETSSIVPVGILPAFSLTTTSFSVGNFSPTSTYFYLAIGN